LALFFKQQYKLIVMKKAYASVIAVLISSFLFAQDKATDINVDINKGGGGGNWYASPWIWIVGAAVFVLLLVALTRGGGRRAD
jgi:hypothetical protein